MRFHLFTRPTTGERTRACLCPRRHQTPACRDGHLIEEHPTFVVPFTNIGWDYEPRGPYRLQSWSETLAPHLVTELCVVDDLLAAGDAFVSRFLPVQPGYYAFMIDERFNLVLGFDASSATLHDHGTPAWFGVQRSFDAITPLVGDPLTVAIWESMARDSAR